MHRCLVHAEDWNESEIRLAPSEWHHLARVMRIRPGERVRVFDGRGREAVAVAVRSEDEALSTGVLRIVESVPSRCSPIPISLLQCLPKGRKMDLIVEKATELGVSEILPVVSERVIVHLTEAQAVERVARWDRVAASAAKQCQTPWLPRIGAVARLDDLLGSDPLPWDLLLVGALGPGRRSLKAVLAEARGRGVSRVGLLIGPEGDLTAAELARVGAVGGVAVGFGPLVMRSETAALFGLSVLTHEFLPEPPVS